MISRAAAAVPRSVRRLQLAVACLALAFLTFAQSSGSEAADTKLDLAVAPLRFLRHSLTMWDPTAAAGQLQDQAYGYLFPMGPVFVLGKWLGLAPWVVQRSWESMLVIAAFLGIVRLAGLLGVSGFVPRLGAGFCYALSPRMLAELGVISSELMPMAALPWVLIPLVRGARTGSPRRAAAMSGVAVLFAGGVNASATLAILPVPALWLLTRSRGPRRAALIRWWPVAVLAASVWWLVPLLVLGKYSPPFLDWIESARTTTSPTSFLNVLRGTDHWQAFLGAGQWPGAWILVSAPAAVLATAAVAAIGLFGVASRATPHRFFLIACVLTGVGLVMLGHVAELGPAFAPQIRSLLDGPLNAFRNVHKFDPVLRLPLAIGLGHALAALASRVPRAATVRTRRVDVAVYPRATAVALVAVAAAVALTPALAGRVVPQTRSANDPSWWSQTGSWLGSHDGAGRALVVPGAAQPTYVWGSPRDDALQPVADGAWTVRDAAPLTQPGYVRLLDSIESILAAGSDSPVLAPLLARAGIHYVVVRDDLDTAASGATALRFVRSTLLDSSGWRRVAAFGPNLLPAANRNTLIDLGLEPPGAAVEVYENPAWTGQRVQLLSADDAVGSNGSSDDLASLIAAGLDPDTAVLFGSRPGALAAASAPSVLTDGIRKREFGFGGINRYSATMTATQSYGPSRAAYDYLPADPGPLSVAAYRGIRDVSASTSASGAAFSSTTTAGGPWSVLDGDASTYWQSASRAGGVGQWLQVDFGGARTVASITLSFPSGAPAYPTRVRLTTDSGSAERTVAGQAGTETLALPSGPTRSVRITVTAMSAPHTQATIGTLQIPGISPTRTLVVGGSSDPDLIAFGVAPGYRASCLTANGAAACVPKSDAAGEEDDALDRTFTLSAAGRYALAGQVRLLPGADLDTVLDARNPLRAISSSVDSADPRERAGAAVDGSTATGWVSEPGDRQPTLQVSIAKPATIRSISVLPVARGPYTAPTSVLVQAGSEVFRAAVADDGQVAFPRPVKTDTVSVTVVQSTLNTSVDSATGHRSLLPVAIGELQLHGDAVPIATAAPTVTIACSAGLSVVVDGRPQRISVDAPTTDVLAGTPVAFRACGASALTLDAGPHQVRLARFGVVAPASTVLTRIGTDPFPAPSVGTAEATRWDATRRSVNVATSARALLVVPENFSAGWRATYDGTRLAAVTVDGWKQAWVVPAGAHGVISLVFTPQRTVDAGLLLGLVLALLLVAAAVRPGPGGALPALTDGRTGRVWLPVGGAVLLALLAGAAGAVVFVALWFGMRTRFARRVPAAASAAGFVLLAGALHALALARGSGDLAGGVIVSGCCLLALGLVAVTAGDRPSPAAPEVAQERPLEQVPGQRGEARGGEGGQ